ncbi:DUF5829 family protein [Flavobacterium sp.]|uniref:DUF5829 family protein n=1 Tax=Flavobacterium sp. TaxID=239 RepID=UPI0038FCD686
MKTKETSFLIFWIIMTFSCQLYSQSKADCNTLFMCIAKDDFDALFSNSFVKDTLFFCKENTTKTSTDEYSGKYFIGEFATIEFLQPSEKNKFGDHLNDIGIEFKSRKIGILDSLKNINSKVEIEKVYLESDTEKFLWYDALKLKENKTNLEFSILEYSAEYLKTLGFTDEECQKTISPTDFNKIVYGNHNYPRKFKSIKSIKLEVNEIGLNYLKQLASNFDFSFNKNYIQCNDFRIYYKVKKKIDKTLLKTIEINLTDSLPSKTSLISPNITVSISNNTAQLLFKH